MTVVEITQQRDDLTQRQRWGHYLVIAFAVVAIMVGMNLRASALNATVLYADAAAGIRAFHPRGWLVDRGGDYVFRVRDMARIGFKTTITVRVVPVTVSTSARNILDSLILSRQRTLAAFSVLAREPFLVREGLIADSMTYTFVSRDEDPFLQGLPTVVEGIDVLIVQGGQAIVVSFLSDADEFNELLPVFQRFLNDLSF